MSALPLLQRFAAVVDSREGIQELRELILQLGVRGKLVSSSSQDEPASVLLAQMKADRAKRVDAGEMRHTPPLPAPQEEEVAFELPRGWEWVRIGDAMNLANGRAFEPSEWSDTGLPIVRIQNLNNLSAPFNCCDFKVDDKYYIKDDDFLISWSGTPGTSFGAFIWKRGRAILNQHIFRAELLGPAFQKPFLRYAINSQLDAMIAQAHGGVGLRHITKGKLERLCIPLPPWSEQMQIVAKIDELMALCDELEARQQRRRVVRIHLNDAALDRLVNAAEPAEFTAAWGRVRDHFDLLYAVPENVAKLRQAILQLAVQGKLVPQEPNEEPAGILIDRLLQQDQEVRIGRRKTASRHQPLARKEAAFSYPQTWELRRLGELLACGPTNGISPKPVKRVTNVKSLTLTATTSGKFDSRHIKYLDCELPADSELWLKDNDILIQRSNTEQYVGVAAVYHGPPGQFVYPDLMMKLRVVKGLNVDYVHLVLNCEWSRDYYRKRAAGTSGSMKKINQAVVCSLPVPIPPAAQQERIVARVRQLQSLCDDLETKLLQQREAADRLTQAVVHSVLNGSGS